MKFLCQLLLSSHFASFLHIHYKAFIQLCHASEEQEFQNDDTLDPLKTDRKGRRKEIGLEGPGERRKGKKYGEP